MTVYIITGHLGSGKTLLSVRLAQRYLEQGRRVASNITLRLEHLLKPRDKTTCIKVPYVPAAEHLEALGPGYDAKPDDYDESRFGLLVLDEAGSWLNSRDWNDKSRRALFTWVTHARKKGWDVALIIQDFESLDAQIRRSITELYVECNRADRIRIPYIGLKLPRIHIAQARYKGPTGTKTDRWWTRGTDLFKGFKTRESVYMEEIMLPDGSMLDMRANVSLLSAWHVVGRYLPPKATLKDWGRFVLTWLVLRPIQAAAAPAPRSGVGVRRATMSEDLSQLIPGLDPQLAMRVYADRRKPARKAPRRPVEPSRLVAHSMDAYRVKKLVGAL